MLHDAALRMQPIRWYLPVAWAKAWRAWFSGRRKRSLAMNTVPEVPREILQVPFFTVPVPTAAAALSPAPAMTLTRSGSPSSRAADGRRVPTQS